MIRVVLWSMVAVGALATSGAAQTGPVTIAVLPFEDRGSYGQDKQVFRALELGIPAALEVELRKHPRVRLVDRARVSAALKAENLSPTARVDAATASRVGNASGARYVVKGNFADFYGKFRIDARVVDVESGRILKVVSNSDPSLQNRADLSRIIQDLAGKILSAAGLPPTSGRAAQPRPVPTEALTQYSLGLLYENEGDEIKAGEHYRRALTAYPDYAEAREGMQRVR
ncbi:MAG TPA: CsgG/HfaB family protein [Gemmatimonadales bacterium]|nr:CsgG/HfaB family protein [Gemmatimonadales bacterium]